MLLATCLEVMLQLLAEPMHAAGTTIIRLHLMLNLLSIVRGQLGGYIHRRDIYTMTTPWSMWVLSGEKDGSDGSFAYWGE